LMFEKDDEAGREEMAGSRIAPATAGGGKRRNRFSGGALRGGS